MCDFFVLVLLAAAKSSTNACVHGFLITTHLVTAKGTTQKSAHKIAGVKVLESEHLSMTPWLFTISALIPLDFFSNDISMQRSWASLTRWTLADQSERPLLFDSSFPFPIILLRNYLF